jgi:hypothetical protein
MNLLILNVIKMQLELIRSLSNFFISSLATSFEMSPAKTIALMAALLSLYFSIGVFFL